MMQSIPTKTGARDQLMNDLKTVIQDAEAWLRHGGHLTGEEFQAAKAKFEQTLSSAKTDLLHLQETVVDGTREAAKATDDYVHENPWKSICIGASVGLLVGFIISRR